MEFTESWEDMGRAILAANWALEIAIIAIIAKIAGIENPHYSPETLTITSC
jgi:hypothetical protein